MSYTVEYYEKEDGSRPAESFILAQDVRPCLKNGGMPNGERCFRLSRQIFAGGLTPGKKI